VIEQTAKGETRIIQTIFRWLLLLLGVVVLAYLVLFLLRPWYSHWGATQHERTMPLSSDLLVPNPITQTTRAITINRPPAEVWPWIIQMGYHRAGWYNYDFVNRMMGAADFVDGSHSSNRIVPELQNLKVGDTVRLAPPIGYTVTQLVPNQLLVMHGQNTKENHVWVYLLTEDQEGNTRLIVRHRDYYRGLISNIIYTIIDPGSFLMERKNLLGLKSRAERNAGG
jgi:hypothetical protein